MIRLVLKRMKYSDKQTLGRMDVFRDSEYLFTLATLEQEWNNNKKLNSCIPPGFYKVEHWSSKKHPNTFIIRDTEPRTYILIHIGNTHRSSSGCILAGLSHGDIDGDGYRDVIRSTDAINKLRMECEDEEVIYIDIKP